MERYRNTHRFVFIHNLVGTHIYIYLQTALTERVRCSEAPDRVSRFLTIFVFFEYKEPVFIEEMVVSRPRGVEYTI